MTIDLSIRCADKALLELVKSNLQSDATTSIIFSTSEVEPEMGLGAGWYVLATAFAGSVAGNILANLITHAIENAAARVASKYKQKPQITVSIDGEEITFEDAQAFINALRGLIDKKDGPSE